MLDSISNKQDKQILRSLLLEELSARLFADWKKGGKPDLSPQDLAEKLLISWYDPLHIQRTAEGLQVTFPHPFFASWFFEQGKALFKHMISQNFGEYTKIDYLNPGASFVKQTLDVKPKTVPLQSQARSSQTPQSSANTYHFSTQLRSTHNFLYSPKNQKIVRGS